MGVAFKMYEDDEMYEDEKDNCTNFNISMRRSLKAQIKHIKKRDKYPSFSNCIQIACAEWVEKNKGLSTLS